MHNKIFSGLVIGLCFSCVGGTVQRHTRGDVEGGFHTLEGEALRERLTTSAAQEAPIAFARLGFLWDADRPTSLEVASSTDGQQWSAWSAVEVLHAEVEESAAFAGVHVVSGRPANFYRLRSVGDAPMPSFLRLEFMADLLPESIEDGSPGVRQKALANPTFSVGRAEVNSRHVWGAAIARCVAAHSPYRMTVHHTATQDSLSAEARLRQIQSYHQNVKGWCDIGYHFLVSRDGRLWQGRPAGQVGAHTGGQNSGNVGIAFIGNYTKSTANDPQLDNAGALIAGLSEQYNIAIKRVNIKGHREYKPTACPGDALFAQLDNLLTRTAPPPPSPPLLVTIKGALYVGTNTAQRIVGATVTLGERTTTTNVYGLWEFKDVVPGEFTVSASAANYQPASISRITSSAVTWASFAMQVTPKGVLQGVIYHGQNTSERIVGVTVSLSSGQSATSDGNGFYRFVDLPAGQYVVSVNDGVHAVASISRTILADKTAWGSIGL